MAYAGTSLTVGGGRLRVAVTGMSTELGHVAGLIEGADLVDMVLRDDNFARDLLGLRPLSAAHCGLICAIALAYLAVVEVHKTAARRGLAPAGAYTASAGIRRTTVDVDGSSPIRRGAACSKVDVVTTFPLIVSAVDLCRTFGKGEAAVHALRRRVGRLSDGRVHRDHGALGLGQVDADASARRPGSPDVRLRSRSTARSSPASTTAR